MVHQHAQVRLNPADETIQVSVIQIRFLVTGTQSNGSVEAHLHNLFAAEAEQAGEAAEQTASKDEPGSSELAE